MDLSVFSITDVMSEEECYKQLRKMRWPDGVVCPHCQSKDCEERGRSSRNKPILRYRCHDCGINFNDLTKTIFRSSHVVLKKWMCCIYLMGLNVSNAQIAKELDVNEKTARYLCEKLRQKVLESRPKVQLSGEVELDEVYVVAGHKGHPEAVKKRVERAAEGV